MNAMQWPNVSRVHGDEFVQTVIFVKQMQRLAFNARVPKRLVAFNMSRIRDALTKLVLPNLLRNADVLKHKTTSYLY